MTLDKLQKANALLNDLKHLNNLIKQAETAKCEWIQFSFGNGSNRPEVCNDPDIIEVVRSIIVSMNKAKFSKMEEEFNSL